MGRRLAIFALIWIVLAWHAHALEPRPDGSTFRIDDGSCDDHSKAVIEMNDDGRYVVVWEGSATTNNNVFLRFYDRSGRPITSAIRVTDDETIPATTPRASITPRGDVAVTWVHRPTTWSSNVYVRTFDADGVPKTAPIAVTEGLLENFRKPDVALDDRGFFVVVWELREEPLPGQYNTIVTGRRYDNRGLVLGDDFEVISSTNNVGAPSVCADVGGDFVVTYSNEYVRRYSRDGVALGDALHFAADSTQCSYYNGEPAEIDCSEEGAFVISRSCHLPLGQYESLIEVWRFDENGQLDGDRIDVTTAKDALGPGMRTSVALDLHSNLVVTWPEHDLSTGLRELNQSRYDAQPQAIGPPALIEDGLNADLMHPTVGMTAHGDYVAVWRDGSRLDGQRYCADTTVSAPVSRVGCSGSSAWFAVDARGRRPLSFQWRKDGDDLVDGPRVRGANSAMLIIDDLDAADAGTYECVVTDACSPSRSVTSAPASLTLDVGTPVGAVQTLSVDQQPDGDALLTWIDTGASEYAVYSSRFAGGSFKDLLGTSPSGSVGFVLPETKGPRFYRVTAHDPICGSGPLTAHP